MSRRERFSVFDVEILSPHNHGRFFQLVIFTLFKEVSVWILKIKIKALSAKALKTVFESNFKGYRRLQRLKVFTGVANCI
jgi:hypothetical protein